VQAIVRARFEAASLQLYVLQDSPVLLREDGKKVSLQQQDAHSHAGGLYNIRLVH
jgi:hypothetical protein